MNKKLLFAIAIVTAVVLFTAAEKGFAQQAQATSGAFLAQLARTLEGLRAQLSVLLAQALPPPPSRPPTYLTPPGFYRVSYELNLPGYAIASADGISPTQLLKLKFTAVGEPVDVVRVSLRLVETDLNSPFNLVNNQVTFYDEANPSVPIATAQFTAQDIAVSSTIAPGSFRIPNGGSKNMLVKGILASISAAGPLTASGDLLKIQYNDNTLGSVNNFGNGVASGKQVYPIGPEVNVRLMKSYPTFAKLPLPSNVLVTGADRILYRFKISATGGDVYLYKLTFNHSSSTPNSPSVIPSATAATYSLYAYMDPAFSIPATTFSGTGLLNAGQCYTNGNGQPVPNTTTLTGVDDIEIRMNSAQTDCLLPTAPTVYKIPSGQSHYFEFRANVSNVETGPGTESISVRLRGDSFYPLLAHPMGTAAAVDADSNDDAIWSPGSTSTPITVADVDFTNGFMVPGLPASDMSPEILTSLN